MAIKVYNGTNYDAVIGSASIGGTSVSITNAGITSLGNTAPNTTNQAVGVILAIVTKPTTANLTIELLESGVVKASETIALADIEFGYQYFRFTTPYTFATTAAGAYTVRVKTSTGTQGTLRTITSGNLWNQIVYDAGTTLGATDDLWIGGYTSSAGTTAKTLTISGTGNSWGSGADTGMTAATQWSMGAATTIFDGGSLVFDTAADCTLTQLGSIIVYKGGLFDMRANASDIEIVNTLSFNQQATDGRFGIMHAGNGLGGQVLTTGKTVSVKAQYASGTGTAANPLVTQAAHGFTVNDEVVIPGLTYGGNQVRYVISIPTSTQLVLSATLGGAESAITNTPAVGSYIGNLTRNSVIKNTTTTAGFWIMNGDTNATPVSSYNYTRLEYANCSSGKGVQLNAGSSLLVDGADPTIDGLVGYHNSAAGRTSITVSGKAAQTFTDLILYNTRGTNYSGQSGFAFSGATNKTINGLYHYADPSSTTCAAAFSLISSAVGNSINNLHSYGANANNGSAGYAIGIYSSSGNTFTNCYVNSSRVQAVLKSTSLDNDFINCRFGTIGTNTIDVALVSNTLNTGLFSGCYFSSATTLSNYLNGLTGTEMRMHEMDGNTSKHRWYTEKGSAWSSGTGLTDTTVRTASSLALAIKPENNTDGFAWETLVPAVPASQCGVFGYGYRNATFSSGTFKVELFLPGSTTADASYTFATTTGSWLPFNISAYYSGSVSRLARVKITAITATASAYAFIDDLYDAGTGNKIAGLDLWHEGKPSPVMVASDVSAVPALVWGYSDQTTSADTMGQRQVDALPTSGYTTPPTTAQITTSVLDTADAIETGLTLRQALRLAAAALAGKISGADTSTVTIRNAVADDADRIIATVDADGNRTAITTDLD